MKKTIITILISIVLSVGIGYIVFNKSDFLGASRTVDYDGTTYTLTTTTVNGDLTVNGTLIQSAAEEIDLYATTTYNNTNGTWTAVTFDDGMISSGGISYSSPTTTIAVDGDYEIHALFFGDKTGGGTEKIQIVLYKNNVIYVDDNGNSPCYAERDVTNDSVTGAFSFLCEIALVANDEIAIYAKDNGGDTRFNVTGSGVTNPANRHLFIEKLD
jgi:uncharacterized protein YxeA